MPYSTAASTLCSFQKTFSVIHKNNKHSTLHCFVLLLLLFMLPQQTLFNFFFKLEGSRRTHTSTLTQSHNTEDIFQDNQKAAKENSGQPKTRPFGKDPHSLLSVIERFVSSARQLYFRYSKRERKSEKERVSNAE